MKDLCIRCDARPALPGRLYCAICLSGRFDLSYFRIVRKLWEESRYAEKLQDYEQETPEAT